MLLVPCGDELIMSRVGKKPIVIPANVKVDVANNRLTASSNFGSFEYNIPDCISVCVDSGNLHVSVKDGLQIDLNRQYWGTARSIINGGIAGLSNKFVKNIELVGVGYRASVEGKKLKLQLGYSHDIFFDIPADSEIVCEKPTNITVKSHNKALVGEIVRRLQSFRPPEPYKGKGVCVVGEYVRRKEGKKK